MKIAVLGGGVVGVTAAYELSKDGHDIVLVEKNDAVGTETSWGNAGMVAPGHSFTWSSPAAPMILLKSLVMANQSLRFRPSLDPNLWRWSLKFLGQCTKSRSDLNTQAKFRLASYSQGILHETLATLDIAYDRIDRGILYFYRSPARLEAGIAHMRIMERLGQRIEVLDRAGVLALEPALAAVGEKIAGGIYCPTDETGSCTRFTAALADHLERNGAEIRTGETVLSIETAGSEITSVTTSAGRLTADLYVMALGNGSAALSRSIGEPLPIYPVKGYSLTLPIGDNPHPPTIGSVDEENLVAISRFGDAVRVTATAEIAGYNTGHRPEDFAFMANVARELYPQGADHDRPHMWAGLRPMTPTNLPFIGRRRHVNLWYDTGHGHIGWTMSHGSARLLADAIAGRPTALDLTTINDS
ncbi:D-amino acid dehydrogenase [Pseudodonghicola flavimaris]|uniref:D-amino acid dehydrogenase n=1 Tax=Pseudodonghicola flavimaris TaxID=3050036 RepID=A0ABT7F2R7_9RHOB|nr:D-amino acid dehydrogenase [Pseudodonghicola flavimaris]MDK3018893.1 D-amino acid dehydrogenase [Pseudodonghicola flavimaris]